MIEDPELREVFKIEFEENIQTLNSELLKLENDPHSADAMLKLMRVAHSMKGGARMIGLTGVVTLAHFFEDMLGAVKNKGADLKRSDFNRMYRALDIIRDLVREAVTGEPVAYDHVKETEAILSPAESDETDGATHDDVDTAATVAVESEQTPSRIENPGQPQTAGTGFTVDTIRVAATKLDTLMNLSGELTISKLQMGLRLSIIDSLTGRLEESFKDIRELESGIRSAVRSGNGHPEDLQVISRLRSTFESAGMEINKLKEDFSEDTTRLNFVSYEFEEVIKKLRLLSLSNIFDLYPRMVRDISGELGKEIEFIVEGGSITADKKILEEMRDPLMHMIRNSIDHGIEPPAERIAAGKPGPGRIKLSAQSSASSITILLEDDGRGLDEEKIRSVAISRKLVTPAEAENLTPAQLHMLIFSPGFSTSKMITDLSGRGVGMEVVLNNIEKLKGKISVESQKGAGTKFIIELPLTLATIRVMIASVNNSPFAVPVDYVYTTMMIKRDEIFTMEGKDTVAFQGEPLSVVSLAGILELQERNPSQTHDSGHSLQCLVINSFGEKVAFVVDYLRDEQEVLAKPLGVMLRKVRNVSGSTILGSGEICIILNPNDLVRSVKSLSSSGASTFVASKDTTKKWRVLLVEDSITTRTQEKRILEGSGFEVVTAVDGQDGFQKLLAGEFDAVVSDIEMPNMDGLTLTESIRREKKYSRLPVVLVTSLSTPEQKKRGLEAGANAYLTKSGFDQRLLVETLNNLL